MFLYSFVSHEWIQTSCENCVKNKRKAQRNKVIDNNPKFLGIPKKFMKAEITDFKLKEDLTINNNLFITGPKGIGKTHLLISLLKEKFVSTGQNCIFIPTIELLLKIRNTYDEKNSDISTEKELLDKYSFIDNLYLDDMGTEKVTDWTVQLFFIIIDRRYREEKNTFITSNLTLKDIANKFDDRIASRLGEMCKIVNMKGVNRRIKK